MACVQPLGLPLQDIVGTGFEHEGTERNRLAKQGWKEGDLGKGDFNVENEFEKEMNPVVIDYDGDDNNDKSVKGKEDKEDAFFFDELVRFENLLGRNVRGEDQKGFSTVPRTFLFRDVREQRGREEDVREENDRAERERRDVKGESARGEICQRESSKVALKSPRGEGDGCSQAKRTKK